MILRRRRQRRASSPRMKLLELTVAVRYASSRLGLLASRVRMTYARTRDETLKTLLERVVFLQTVLDVLAVRLETLASIGALTGETLAIVRQVLEEARRVGGAQPMIESMLLDLENMISSIAASSGVEMPEASASPRVTEEVRDIMERARAVAEARLAESFPS